MCQIVIVEYHDDDTCLSTVFQHILVNRYQNVSILDFIGAKDDGGGEWWQLEL